MSEPQAYIETALPVPRYDEVLLLNTFVKRGLPNNIERHEHLAEEVKKISPAIIEVIRHDISFYEDYELPESYSNDQCLEYAEGIEIGYDFAIGVITYLYYLRSGFETVEGYLQTAPAKLGHIPVQTKQQVDRVKKVRTSDESILVAQPCVTIADENNDKTNQESILSSDLARIDSGDYLYYAHEVEDLLDYLIQDWIYNLHYEKSDNTLPLQNGINHGFNNAVEMYIQSREEAIIQSHEF